MTPIAHDRPNPYRQAAGHHRAGLQRVRIRCLALVSLMLACGGSDPDRPHLLLFVMDTLRADAVDTRVRGMPVAPTLHTLGEQGLRYTRAYSHSPWTLPAHVSLFTGTSPPQHGVTWRDPLRDATGGTLAETLAAAGYQTFGHSENPWVGATFHLDAGFDEFVSPRPGAPSLDAALERWLPARDPDRPVFLFVNVIDPHWPYEGHPAVFGTRNDESNDVSQWPADYLCGELTQRSAQRVLHRLYLGDVARADAKLAALRDRLAQAVPGDWLTVVTADHGEHFGEHRLASHQFSVREAVLRVPLVVHGLPGVAPAHITTPVGLARLAPSLRAWLGVGDPGDAALLPTRDHEGAAGSEALEQPAIVAVFHDPDRAPAQAERELVRLGRAQSNALRAACTPEDPVWGDQRAEIRGRFKWVRIGARAPELYDLACDPDESHDLAPRLPAALRERIAAGLPQDAELAAALQALACGADSSAARVASPR